MFNLGWIEVGLIVLAALLIFGPNRLPELGGSVAKALRGFKSELRSNETDDDSGDRT